ncbi:hypothetical protein S245_072225, partial [Arachis hypogaea]
MGIRYQNVAACATMVLVMVMAEIADICANSSTLLHSPCLERERQALVKFKASLTDSSNMLSSWHGDDCCRWKGIGCDNVTGHVVMLDLTTPYDQYLEGGNVNSSLLALEYLTHLDLTGIYFYLSPIPMFIGSMQRLRYLSLSYARFGGRIPSNLGNLTNLHFLDLSGNEFSRDSNINWISHLPLLEHLNMMGSFIYNESQLLIMDLGENQISGTIPSWSANTFSSLQILRLRQNRLSGSIPSQICELSSIQILDLSRNNLNGSIPRCIGNLRGMTLEAPALSPTSSAAKPRNSFNRRESDWREEDVIEVIKGRELDYIRILKLVVIMDLSQNNLVGSIPDGITLLNGLHSLNLSNNHLIGKIPNMIGDMISLESFDVSSNQLSGTIPSSMSALTSLSHLNLSHNNFSGPVPTDNQFLTYDPSSYADNPYLCGFLLPNKCGYSHQVNGTTEFEDEDSNLDKLEKWLFYFVIVIGYATGFWGVIGTLWFKRTWRHAYFGWVEDLADTIYVTTAIRMAKLKKWMMMMRNRV